MVISTLLPYRFVLDLICMTLVNSHIVYKMLYPEGMNLLNYKAAVPKSLMGHFNNCSLNWPLLPIYTSSSCWNTHQLTRDSVCMGQMYTLYLGWDRKQNLISVWNMCCVPVLFGLKNKKELLYWVHIHIPCVAMKAITLTVL